jgi:hypothetical protein
MFWFLYPLGNGPGRMSVLRTGLDTVKVRPFIDRTVLGLVSQEEDIKMRFHYEYHFAGRK